LRTKNVVLLVLGAALVIVLAVGAINVAALGLFTQSRVVQSPSTAGGQPVIAGVGLMDRSSGTGAQGIPSAADPTGALGAKGIVVVGSGTIQVAPDLAFVTAGTQTRAGTAKEAQDQNNATMTTVIAAIKRLGVADKDVQTRGISLSPVIQGNENKITGYEATNAVTVRIESISQVGPVIDAAVAAGANSGVSIRFALKDTETPYRQALAAAGQSARGNAEAIAKAMGVQLGPIESVVEESVNMPMPMEFGGMGVKAASVATPVEPGQITVSARLRITYSY